MFDYKETLEKTFLKTRKSDHKKTHQNKIGNSHFKTQSEHYKTKNT